MGCGILYRMVAERIGLGATLATRRTDFTALAHVRTEWVNVAISGKMGVILLLGMGNCRA